MANRLTRSGSNSIKAGGSSDFGAINAAFFWFLKMGSIMGFALAQAHGAFVIDFGKDGYNIFIADRKGFGNFSQFG